MAAALSSFEVDIKAMMARKNTIKTDNPGSIHFDPRTKSVMAETSHLQDNIKEKVNAVREVMPGKSNNEIILVLQYYDYNVEKAIQAYVEDGGKQALTEWHYSGNTAPKKKRNKKKKSTAGDSTTQLNGHVPSTEMVPNGIVPNGSVESDTEPTKTNSLSDVSSTVSSLSLSPTTCTVPTPSMSDPDQTSHTVPLISTPPLSATSRSKSPTVVGSNATRTKSQSPVSNVKSPTQTSSGKPSQSATTTSQNLSSGNSLPQNTPNAPSQLPVNGSSSQPPVKDQSQPPVNDQSQPPVNSQKQHQHSRQNHHSGSLSHRPRTSSERSSEGYPVPKQVHKTLEKSVKDLHRQTISLERLRLILQEEVDKNYKRIKSVFDEMRACLNEREVELMKEMDQVKVVANDTFSTRQKNAIELKHSTDRAERMDDKQLAQLRADIKHFVSDRKIDEDLSRTTRFLYDSDYLKREISQFGEVVPVKCTYSLRRPSVSSVASSEDHPAVEPSNSKPVSQSEGEVEHPHGLDSKETAEVAELQLRLRDSLHVQGYDKSSPRPANQPYRENSQNQRRPDQRQFGGPRPQSSGGSRPQSSGGIRTQSGRGGYGYRGRGGGYRGRGQGRPRSPRKDYPQDGKGNNSNVNSSQ